MLIAAEIANDKGPDRKRKRAPVDGTFLCPGLFRFVERQPLRLSAYDHQLASRGNCQVHREVIVELPERERAGFGWKREYLRIGSQSPIRRLKHQCLRPISS